MQMGVTKPQWTTPRRVWPPLEVPGRPYHAHFEVTSSNVSGDVRHWTGEEFRNSQGNLRAEYRDGPNGEESVLLWFTPCPGALFVPASRALTQIPAEAPNSPRRSQWWFAYGAPNYTDNYKAIFGLRCRRIDFFDLRTKAPAGEAWISEDRGIALSDSGSADGITFERKVTAIDFDEPSPDQFVMPAGYTVIE
jgi:hypothetical protein